MDLFNNAGIFLVNTLFDLYLFVLAIRLILVCVHADHFNPLSQFFIKLTNTLITFCVPHFLGLLILAGVDVIKIILNLFFYLILFQALLSWIQPGFSPLAKVLMQMTAPILRPIQRVIPLIGGFDISPVPALIGL